MMKFCGLFTWRMYHSEFSYHVLILVNMPATSCSLIKEFDRVLKDEEKRNTSEVNKQLNDKKQFMIKELNSYVTMRKTYQSSLGNKRIELFDAGNDQVAEDNVQMASEMSNQQLIDSGMKQMDQTDQAIERSKMVVAQTVEVGAQTATTLTQ
uniref:Uncharacterized protein n=1 Tax=Aegilops tauschii subsp. strangulata TaxID=200361 RepID=A0A453AYU1_AEGTS